MKWSVGILDAADRSRSADGGVRYIYPAFRIDLRKCGHLGEELESPDRRFISRRTHDVVQGWLTEIISQCGIGGIKLGQGIFVDTGIG